VSSKFHAPAALTPGIISSSTHLTEGWMGPSDGLNAVAKRKKSLPCWESKPGRPASSIVTILTELSRLLNLEADERIILKCT
jgi:hypothetical protein